ncbi:unnamed protein product [Musa textilis]
MKKKHNSKREQPLTQSNYYSTKNVNTHTIIVRRPVKEVAGHDGQEEEARRGLEAVAVEGRRVEVAVDRAVQEDAAVAATVVQREVEDREPAVPWAGQDLRVLDHAGGAGDRGGGASCGSCSF